MPYKYPFGVNDLSKAKHCYQSLVNENIYLATRFHPKFSNAPEFLNIYFTITIQKENKDDVKIESSFYMKLVDEKCESTIEISDKSFEFDRISIKVDIFVVNKQYHITPIYLDILANYEEGIKDIWDENYILKIFLKFVPGRDKVINEFENTIPDKFYDLSENLKTDMKYICTVIYGRGYVFEYTLESTNISLPTFYAIYISYKYSEYEVFGESYSAWPCKKSDASTKKNPIFVLREIDQKKNIAFKFKTYADPGEYKFNVTNLKVIKLKEQKILSKREFIYVFRTNWGFKKCQEKSIINFYGDRKTKYLLFLFEMIYDEDKGFIQQHKKWKMDTDGCLINME